MHPPAILLLEMDEYLLDKIIQKLKANFLSKDIPDALICPAKLKLNYCCFFQASFLNRKLNIDGKRINLAIWVCRSDQDKLF